MELDEGADLVSPMSNLSLDTSNVAVAVAAVQVNNPEILDPEAQSEGRDSPGRR